MKQDKVTGAQKCHCKYDKTKLEVHEIVIAQLRVMISYKIRREVHSSATAGARQAVIRREVHSSAAAGARQ